MPLQRAAVAVIIGPGPESLDPRTNGRRDDVAREYGQLADGVPDGVRVDRPGPSQR
jgi:hypothetical protein